MSDVQGRPSGTMSTERRYGIAISVALILGGVYWALTGLTEGSKSSQGSYRVEGDSLLIKNSSAEIEVRSGDGPELKVDRQFERNVFGSDPEEKYDANDHRLELDSGGCGFLSFNCKTSYVLTVPRDVELTVESSSGDVTLSGLTAGVNVKTSSGDVSIGVPAGDEAYKVDTKTSSGDESSDVKSDPAATREITARTSSGDVSIEYTH